MNMLPDKYTTEDTYPIIVQLDKENEELKKRIKSLEDELAKGGEALIKKQEDERRKQEEARKKEEEQIERLRRKQHLEELAETGIGEIVDDLEKYARDYDGDVQCSIDIQDNSDGLTGRFTTYDLEGGAFLEAGFKNATQSEVEGRIKRILDEYAEERYEYMRRMVYGD